MMKKPWSRRDFLKAGAVASMGAVMAACTPQAAPTAQQSGGEGKDQPTSAPETSGDAVTVTFMGWGATEEDEGVKAAIKQFESEQSKVKVTWLHTPEQYAEKFLASVAAGTPPDTAFVGSDVFRTYARDNLLLDITNYVKADTLIGAKDYFIEPQEEQRCSYNGKWYGIGSCWVAPHIYYNLDTFEKAGIEPPSNDPEKAWDWDTFMEVVQKLTVDTNGKNALDPAFDANNIQSFGTSMPLSIMTRDTFSVSNGGGYVDDKTGEIIIDSPEALEAMQRIYDMSAKYHIAPTDEMTTQLGMSTSQMLENGKLAMVIDGSWALSWMYKIKGRLGTGVLPKMKTPSTNLQAHLHSAMSGSKNPEAAWQWVRFLSTPFYQTMFCKIGLWLPSQKALMTEEGLKTWITEGVHPEGYDQIVTKYVPEYGHVQYMPPGWPKINPIMDPAWDQIRMGTAQAADVLPAAVEEANKILAEEAKAS